MCSSNCCDKKKLLNFSWMIRKNFLDKYDKTEFGRKLCICSARALIFHRIVKRILEFCYILKKWGRPCNGYTRFTFL